MQDEVRQLRPRRCLALSCPINSCEVNGRDAVWVVIDIKNASRRGVVLGTTDGKTAYILTCSTLPEKFEGIRPTFEGVLGTFKVTK